ncbi:MAG: hypothetical protein AABW59_02740 [archaeon]
MSLKEPDSDYDEIIDEKKRGSKMRKLSMPNFKNALAPLIIGIVIGVALSIIVILPYVQENQSSTCKECLNIKEILNKENDCLYQYIPSASDALMLCRNLDQQGEDTNAKDPNAQVDTNSVLTPPTGPPVDENMPSSDLNQ